MKRIILAAFVGVLVSGPAKAEEMTPLKEFLSSNPSSGINSSGLYIFYRCSSLFGVMVTLSPKGGAMEKMLKPKMGKFLAAAIKLQSEVSGMSPEEATKQVMKTFEPFGKKYVEAANKNYVNRGHYLEGALIDGDLKICGEIDS